MKEYGRKFHLHERGEIVILDKPLTWTSFDLVNKFRYRACKHLGIKKLKVGHAGTLDPLATGVMVLCTGRCTKQIDEIQAGEKEYVATIRLGSTTPSFDRETEPDAFFPYEHITESDIRVALTNFIGDIEQIPPAFSAIRIDGKRAYNLARQGKDVEIKPRNIQIRSIDLLSHELPLIKLRICCSKGTYIRSLARDIAQALGSGGHLEALCRTRIGEYRLEDCLQVEEIDDFLERYILPIDTQQDSTHQKNDHAKNIDSVVEYGKQ